MFHLLDGVGLPPEGIVLHADETLATAHELLARGAAAEALAVLEEAIVMVRRARRAVLLKLVDGARLASFDFDGCLAELTAAGRGCASGTMNWTPPTPTCPPPVYSFPGMSWPGRSSWRSTSGWGGSSWRFPGCAVCTVPTSDWGWRCCRWLRTRMQALSRRPRSRRRSPRCASAIPRGCRRPRPVPGDHL
ncbi:hypothetical protein [Nonomuraea jabiensis]|uniref:hypothetical protein n=1 Tax=Nonomuraea jabiensis TaxID=882448 RepID=UPI003D74F40A